MSSATNLAVTRRWFAELNRGNLAAADEIYAPGYVLHDPSAPVDLPPGPTGVKQFLAPFLTAFPDAQGMLEDLLSDGDKVVVRFTVRGTHQGLFAGLTPTGKPFVLQGISILRFVDSQIAEEWEILDGLGLFQQLGAFPMPVEPQHGNIADI